MVKIINTRKTIEIVKQRYKYVLSSQSKPKVGVSDMQANIDSSGYFSRYIKSKIENLEVCHFKLALYSQF